MNEQGRTVNGVKVGRADGTRLIPIDSARLAAELRKRGLSKAEASSRLMRSKTFINNILYQNGVTKTTMKGIESVLGIPPETYLLRQEPKAEPEEKGTGLEDAPPTLRLAGVEDRLERIAVALERLTSVPGIEISRVERCALLLKQMMCYGMCPYDDFRRKAEGYGFTEDEIKQAIYQSCAVQELKGGKDIWLRRAGARNQ